MNFSVNNVYINSGVNDLNGVPAPEEENEEDSLPGEVDESSDPPAETTESSEQVISYISLLLPCT